MRIKDRFRKFLPVVIDVETGGFNAKTDALLEIAAITMAMDEQGILHAEKPQFYHVKPFEGANMEKSALEFTGIDPYHPFRFAVTEKEALETLFKIIRSKVKENHCQRAILVGHNAHFDLSFVAAASTRNQIKHNPFHAFSVLDTVTLSALALGETVLARALKAAKLEYDPKEAHSALYDAERTADLFCHIVNQQRILSQ